MIINIPDGTYDIATTSSSCFLLNEAGVREIAAAMNAQVHIGSGTGTFYPYTSTSYTAPIEGTPFVEVGEYLFTVSVRSGTKYATILNKNDYSLIRQCTFNTSSRLLVGYETNGVRFISVDSTIAHHIIFCSYTDVKGETTNCVIYKTYDSNKIDIHHLTSTATSIYLPSCFYSDEPDYACIQELAFNPKAAIFNNLYSCVCQHDCNSKSVLLNGVEYDVLSSGDTSYPTIYIKRG